MADSTFGPAGTSILETMSRLAAEAGSINLGQRCPTGLEPPELIEAAVRALREGPHQYPPMLGLPALRQAVAANAKRFGGLDVDWEREAGVTPVPISAFYGARDVRTHVRFCFAKPFAMLHEAVERLSRWNKEQNRKAAS